MKIIRSLGHPKKLFLTFDDGPDPLSTPQVLKVLKENQVKATFFLVAQKAQAQKGLLEEILFDGHTIGNHSLDHGYKNFFRRRQILRQWILDSENLLSSLIGGPTVGFRPPAGVVTPVLRRALAELEMPLILWQKRFYDAIIPLKSTRLLGSLEKTPEGSIILLHDRQKSQNLPDFLNALSHYINRAREKNWDFAAIKKESI